MLGLRDTIRLPIIYMLPRLPFHFADFEDYPWPVYPAILPIAAPGWDVNGQGEAILYALVQ